MAVGLTNLFRKTINQNRLDSRAEYDPGFYSLHCAQTTWPPIDLHYPVINKSGKIESHLDREAHLVSLHELLLS